MLSTCSAWRCISSEDAKMSKTCFLKFSQSVEDTLTIQCDLCHREGQMGGDN